MSAATLLDPQTKAFIPLGEAEAKFKAQGITKDKRVVAYCGGGISATVDLFLLHQLGYDKLTLYDGSMGEWAKDRRFRSRRDSAPSLHDHSSLCRESRRHVRIRHHLRIRLVDEIEPGDDQQRGDAEGDGQRIVQDEVAGDDAEQRRDEGER